MKQEPLARLIVLARRRLKQATHQRAAGFGLSSQQFWVLVHLAAAGSPSLRMLCDSLRIDAPTASRIVTTLIRRGLVRSAHDPADRRRTRLVLTPRGRALGPVLQPIAEDIRAAAEQDLTRAEAAVLRRLLVKVIDSLDRYQARGDAA